MKSYPIYLLGMLLNASPLAMLRAAEPVTITEVFRQPHPELADREILVKRIELEPGAAAPAHVHPGMVTGYVLAGELEFQLRGGPLQHFKAGATFFEPPGSHHLVAKNPGATKTTIIAFVVNPKGAPLSTPLPPVHH